MFGSVAIDHYPSVRIEVWTSQPAAETEERGWEVVQDVVLPLERRTLLRLRSQFGDWTPVLLELDQDHHVRAHVRGRADAVARGEAEFFHGAEQWLVQLWPA